MAGHSQGTAVTLEFAVLYPERVDSLMLINGMHGHVFSTAFQPMFVSHDDVGVYTCASAQHEN